MGLATKVNGFSVHKFVKAEVSKSGQMAPCMRAIGRTTRPMVRVD